MTTQTPYLTTASGQRYRLTGPDLDTPRIGDIAHHLAQINRFTGAAQRPYSVAEHSLLCERIAAAEGAGPMARLCALMHDAHEAYTSDMASPAKVALVWWDGQQRQAAGTSDYDYFERVHARNIRESFGLSDAFQNYAKDIRRWDLIALATERRDLMPQDEGDGWEILKGVEPLHYDACGIYGPIAGSHREGLSWNFWRGQFSAKYRQLRNLVDA